MEEVEGDGGVVFGIWAGVIWSIAEEIEWVQVGEKNQTLDVCGSDGVAVVASIKLHRCSKRECTP